MLIKLPVERAYYSTVNEPDNILLWIPECELKAMAIDNKVNERILDDYPTGLEVQVYEQNLKDFEEQYGLRLDINPEKIAEAYRKACRMKLLSKEGIVQAKALEDYADGKFFESLPEPKYDEGEEPRKVFERLAR